MLSPLPTEDQAGLVILLSYTANRSVADWPSEPMPFTVAHAAAALPLRRFNLVWSAFLVGSMAPDFPYVIGSIRYRSLGHDFPGVVLFTLPASFAALWFYHWAIKKPMAGLLPIGMQQRLKTNWESSGSVAADECWQSRVSIILGIATHLVWDSFTHAHTWPWLHFPWLRYAIKVPLVGWMSTFMFLQYASTFVGSFALGVWILCGIARRPGSVLASLPPPQVARLAGCKHVCHSDRGRTAAGVAAHRRHAPTINHWDWFMLNFSVTALAVAFWELLFYCLFMTLRQYAAQPAKLRVM